MKLRVFTLMALVGAAAMVAALPAGCRRPASERPAAIQHHCPMHPTVVSDKPGVCPICNMDLTPAPQAGHGAAADGGETPPGLAAVTIAPEARARMGLVVGVVEKRALAREIRASARIVPDETRLHHVTVKIDGYVERLFAATTGAFVKEGDPLLTVYSPALVTAQQEYLTVLKDNPDFAVSARRRLRLWDISDEQIDRLARTGQPERVVTLFAAAGGWIIERNISAGHKVSAGEQLLVLGDLSSVWADSDVYQSDMPAVRLGMPVELSVSAVPGQTFTGKVSFIAPVLDPVTRTVKVRMELPNAGLRLKPEMYGVARLAFDLGERTAIPASAVMRTGERTYAFREAADGRLTPVMISIGARSGDWFELLSGLEAGDRVVTSANFLVDSESSMQAALQAITGKGP